MRHLYDTAETTLCGGVDVARHANRNGTEAELAAADLLLRAIEAPDVAELRHTADVGVMIRSGEHNAAVSMHVAHTRAELEREDLGASEAALLDLYVGGVLLEANAWRLSRDLVLAPPC